MIDPTSIIHQEPDDNVEISSATNYSDAAKFLRCLHPTPGRDSRIEVRYVKERSGPDDDQKVQRTFFTNGAAAAKYGVDLSRIYHVYTGNAGRDNSDQGSDANCTTTNVLWAEIDCKLYQDMPNPLGAAYDAVEAFEIAPSIIVESGGGLHLYWLLSETLDVRGEVKTDVVHLNKWLSKAIIGPDLKPDHTSDLARIYRLPGTLNHKAKYGEPKPVRLMRCVEDRTYSLDDIRRSLAEAYEWATPLKVLPGTADAAAEGWESDTRTPEAKERRAGLYEGLRERLKDVALRQTTKDLLDEKSDSEACMRLATGLVGCGFTKDETLALFEGSNCGVGLAERHKGVDDAERLIRLTVDKAKAWVEQNARNVSPASVTTSPLTVVVDEGKAAPAEAKKAFRYTPLTFAEILDQPKQEYLLDGTFHTNSVAFLCAAPGAGKSFFAYGLALSVALDTAFLGRSVKPGTSVFIAGEGKSGAPVRLKAFLKENEVNTPPDNFFMLPHSIPVADPLALEATLEALDTLPKPINLVVVDTLARCFTGNENMADDAGKFMNAIDAIKIATGACVLVLHHTGKSGDFRGSTVFPGNTDAMYIMRKSDNDPQFFTLTCTKQKDGAEDDPVALYGKKVDLGDGESSLVMQLVPEELTISVTKKGSQAPAKLDVMLEVLESLGDKGAGFSAWHSACRKRFTDMSVSTFQRAVNTLKEQERVARGTGKFDPYTVVELCSPERS